MSKYDKLQPMLEKASGDTFLRDRLASKSSKVTKKLPQSRFLPFLAMSLSVCVTNTVYAQLYGACCLPDGGCVVVPDAQSCTISNGTFTRGVGCENVVCIGACCRGNGSCSETSPLNCNGVYDDFRGVGTVCDDQTCGGACCRVNGNCQMTNIPACDVPDLFHGLGTLCVDVDCVGGCCAGNGTCLETTQVDCETNQQGLFLGLEETCDGAVCDGACCTPDKACIETGPTSCSNLRGIYQGRGTICMDDCPTLMPTAFVYQGQLKRNGIPVDGLIDTRFSLWLSATGEEPENQIGDSLFLDSIQVENGLFNVELDFGQDVYNGNARWLLIALRDHSDLEAQYTALSPRQPLTPTPYALQTRGIVVRDDGNVGIGTKEPTSKLEIAAQNGLAITGSQPFMILRDSNDANQRSVIQGADGNIRFYPETFFASGPPAVVINNGTGNVGVGTTDPNGGLHVKHEPVSNGGTLTLEGTTHSYLSFFPRGTTAGRKGWIGYGGALTNDLTVSNDTGGDINLITSGDVVVAGSLEVGLQTISTGYQGGILGEITCPAGTSVISGGCDCSQDSYIDASFPYNNGWFCLCHSLIIGNERVKAYAICAKVK